MKRGMETGRIFYVVFQSKKIISSIDIAVWE